MWKHIATLQDGAQFELDGLNIWDYVWNDTGERIHITDPQYHQPHTFVVYEISCEGIQVRFAAGEFSNLVWGIYRT